MRDNNMSFSSGRRGRGGRALVFRKPRLGVSSPLLSSLLWDYVLRASELFLSSQELH